MRAVNFGTKRNYKKMNSLTSTSFSEENVKGHDLKKTPFCEIEKQISPLF